MAACGAGAAGRRARSGSVSCRSVHRPMHTIARMLRRSKRACARLAWWRIENIVLDIVWSSGDPDQAVTELMQRGAQMLIPCGSSASVAAQRRAPTIPIVFINVGNPIAMGLVENLFPPGRNATGFSDIQSDLSGKLVDVARELRKLELAVGYIWYTGWPDGENRYRATEQAAQSAGIQFSVARNP